MLQGHALAEVQDALFHESCEGLPGLLRPKAPERLGVYAVVEPEGLRHALEPGLVAAGMAWGEVAVDDAPRAF